MQTKRHYLRRTKKGEVKMMAHLRQDAKSGREVIDKITDREKRQRVTAIGPEKASAVHPSPRFALRKRHIGSVYLTLGVILTSTTLSRSDCGCSLNNLSDHKRLPDMSTTSKRRVRARPRVKSVFVHRYPRFRLGRWEDVCQHYRSLPQPQLSFDFEEA